MCYNVEMANRRTDIDAKREEIETWLREGVPRLEVARRLSCRYATLKVRIDQWGLSHLKNQGARGRKSDPKRKTALEYLGGDTHKTPLRAKKKLIEDGIFAEECSHCGLTEWLGRPAPLVLDHIDGNRHNWVLENLRILCHNCHAQTPTYAGRNAGNYAPLAE